MMPVMDGYDACEAIRSLDQDSDEPVSILFTSAKAGLEDKIRGYEVGGNDYITKPFDPEELAVKIELILKDRVKLKHLADSKHQSEEMAFNLMTTASKLGAISQFLRTTLASNNIDSSINALLHLSRSSGIGGTLKVEFDGNSIIKSDDGITRQIDLDIIKNMVPEQRIFHFGNNRAIFSWKNITLLVRDVGDEADNIALMLDGLSASIDFLQMQSMLIKAVDRFQEENSELKAKAANITREMEQEMRITFSEMGSGSNLTEEEEESINQVIENSKNMLDDVLIRGKSLEQDLETVLNTYNSRGATQEAAGGLF